MGKIVFLVSLLPCVCFGIRLPGLEEEDTSAESLLTHAPFARVVNAEKESQSETQSERFGIPEVSLATTQTQFLVPKSESLEHRIETLLGILLGNRSWKSYIKNLTMSATSTKPTQRGQINDESDAQRPLSSGFFSNQISAGSVFNRHEQESAYTQRPSVQSHLYNYFQVPQFRHGEDLTKTDMNYTGSLITSNLHEPKAIETTTQLPQLSFGFHIPATRPSSQSNAQQMYRGPALTDHNPQYYSNSMSETFDPNAVNQFQSGFNPNNSPAVFATQTGSDPQNSHLGLKFDADRVNTNFMQGNIQNTESKVPPGVLSLLSLQSAGDSGNSVNSFSRYDADQLNRDLLGRNFAVSGNPSNMMTPTFLRDNINGQIFDTDKIIQPDSSSIMANRLYNAQESSLQKKKSNNVATAGPFMTAISNRIHTPLGLVDSGVTQFNFVPGNLYPGLGQNINEQQNLKIYDPNSVMTEFDPNSINSKQDVFNPNSVSWIKPRGLKKRNFDKGKLSQMGLVNKDLLGSLNNVSSSSQANQSAQDIGEEANNVDKNRPDLKFLFGNPNSLIPNSTSSDTYNHAAIFNPNTLNTDEGQNNFVPGQIAPYGSEVSNTFGGNSALRSFYGPHSDSNLFNFNIGKLLEIGNKSTSGNTGFGLVGIFNPTSLNNILMSSMSENQHQSNNGQNIPRQGLHTALNLSSDFVVSHYLTSNDSVNNFGFITGGFDANAANVGFGDILQDSSSSGFGFGSTYTNNSSSWQASTFGSFGAVNGFDPNKVNAGFGANGYGTGVLNGPTGAFGGSFDADKINTGDNSTDVQELMDYFLGAKMKTEGRLGPGGIETGLYDSRFIGEFNPDSVNQVSYDPNYINILNIHFNPSEMLEKNPGMDNNILASVGNLFDPDKVNSLYKQQAFTPNELLHATGVEHINSALSDKGNTEHNWNERNGSSLPLFDPFEVMKQMMGTPNTMPDKPPVYAFVITPATTSQKSTTNTKFSKPTQAPLGPSTTSGISYFPIITADTGSGKPLITSTTSNRIPFQTSSAQSTTAEPP